jgi:apolipoprotein N-acyltransferase
VLICYESMVPHEALRRVKNGAQVLVVVTNDAWFQKSSAAMHHFEMAIMHAVQLRRPVVHCGNNGISGFIEPSGRVSAESQLDEIVQLTAPVQGVTARTVFSYIGDTFAYLALAGLVALWRRP